MDKLECVSMNEGEKVGKIGNGESRFLQKKGCTFMYMIFFCRRQCRTAMIALEQCNSRNFLLNCLPRNK